MMTDKKYIPALRVGWLTGFYDKLIGMTMPEQEFREALINEAFGHEKINDALEFGIGTASNSILAKSIFPNANITGLDIDSEVLTIAKKKIDKIGTEINLDIYKGGTMKYEDNSFDLVYSSLVFHHLLPSQKEIAFAEIHRILRPDARLVFLDWGEPNTLYTKGAFYLVRLFDGWQNTRDNANGNYLKMLTNTGFGKIVKMKGINTVFGSLELITSSKNN